MNLSYFGELIMRWNEKQEKKLSNGELYYNPEENHFIEIRCSKKGFDGKNGFLFYDQMMELKKYKLNIPVGPGFSLISKKELNKNYYKVGNLFN